LILTVVVFASPHAQQPALMSQPVRASSLNRRCRQIGN
jgi:hypothetical protein